MYSKHHAFVSALLSVVIVIAAEVDTMTGVVLVGYATAVGVLIDLDHFLIARHNTGDWRAARFCLANPRAAVLEQDRIFDPDDIGVLQRLLSHLLIAGVLTAGIAVLDVFIALLTAIVLYAHLLADVAADLRRLDERV